MTARHGRSEPPHGGGAANVFPPSLMSLHPFGIAKPLARRAPNHPSHESRLNMKDPSAADDQARWWKGLFLYHRGNSGMKHYRKNRIGGTLEPEARTNTGRAWTHHIDSPGKGPHPQTFGKLSPFLILLPSSLMRESYDSFVSWLFTNPIGTYFASSAA